MVLVAEQGRSGQAHVSFILHCREYLEGLPGM